MKRTALAIGLFALAMAITAAVGPAVVFDAQAPDCVTGGVSDRFEVAITFDSPDGETMRFVDIAIPDSWTLGTIYNPPAQTIAGTWTGTPYPGGNGIQWEFNRTAGPGGGLADGETAVFAFDATPVNPNERTIEIYIEGDVASPTPPHSAQGMLTYDLCDTPDDDTDDDTDDDVDDDDWHDDDWHDDDDADDDADDDTDDDVDDDADDDEDVGPIEGDDDDDDDDDNGVCGC